MNESQSSAAARVFAIPELLEHILSYLLCSLLPLTDQEDPRSVRVLGNASTLRHLTRCSEVNGIWYRCILQQSTKLRRALFLTKDTTTTRSWDTGAGASRARQLYSYYTAPYLRAPQLNPVIQTTFPPYHFRFWHLSLESTGNKHVAYLIITRRGIAAVESRLRTRQGKRIQDMLLSQPPPLALEATIWEERDSKEYIGRTTILHEPTVRSESGVTIGLIHERVAKMFDKHQDVAAIKLTTT